MLRALAAFNAPPGLVTTEGSSSKTSPSCLLNKLSAGSSGSAGTDGFRLTEEMKEVISLYASTAPRTPGAEAIMGAAVSIIVSGATCLAHWDRVWSPYLISLMTTMSRTPPAFTFIKTTAYASQPYVP